MVMSQEVEQGEDDGEGLLHAQEAVEGPFAVELEDGFAVGWVAGEALVSDDVLACVVAFRRAVPEQDAMLQCCQVLYELLFFLSSDRWICLQIAGPSGTQLVDTHSYMPRQELVLCIQTVALNTNLDAFFEIWQAIAQ